MTRPAGVEIAGVAYGLRDGEESYRLFTERTVVRQPAIAGASRASETGHPDSLPWRQDDWVGGEGAIHVDPDVVDSYYQSGSGAISGAVDVATSGELKLGLTYSTSVTLTGSITSGPHLVSAGGFMFVYYNGAVRKRTAVSTWDAAVDLSATMGTVQGKPDVKGGYMFAAGTTRVVRVSTTPAISPATQEWANSAGRYPVYANNRLYYVSVLTDTTELRMVPVTETAIPGTGWANTAMYVASGTLLPRGSTAIGEDIWFLVQDTGERPALHSYTSDDAGAVATGREKGQLPLGSAVDTIGTPITDLNNLVFIAAYTTDSDAIETPMLIVATDDTLEPLAYIRPGTDDRFTAIAATANDEIVLGTESGRIYRYDLTSGGISEFIQSVGEPVTSIACLDGRYFIATLSGTTGKVYETLTSGTRYVSQAALQSSLWDFGYPDETKVLTEIEIHTTPLPSGTSVSVQVSLEDGTAITTDASGSTMSHATAGATRSTFTVSDHDTERLFRYLKTITVLNGGANTPTVYSVTLRARSTGVIRYYTFLLDLSDDDAANRLSNQQLSGAQKYASIKTLVDNAATRDFTTSRLFQVTPLYPDSGLSRPGPDADSFTAELHSADIRLNSPGEGTALVTVKQ